MVFSIGLLVDVLEGFFTSPAESPESSPIWYGVINDLVNKIGSKLLGQSSYEEAEVESDVSHIICELVFIFFVVEEFLTFELVPVLCIDKPLKALDTQLAIFQLSARPFATPHHATMPRRTVLLQHRMT